MKIIETPIQEDVEDPEKKSEEGTPTPSVAPSTRVSKARRVSRRVPSITYAQSEADTEYTVEHNTSHTKIGEIRVEEATHIRSFAEWAKNNIPEDPVFSEVLFSSADDQTIHNELSKNVVAYIRTRKDQDPQYDAYEELRSSNSRSSEWATENIK